MEFGFNLTKDRIAAAHGRYFLYFTVGGPVFPLKIAPSCGEIWTSVRGFLGSPESVTQRALS